MSLSCRCNNDYEWYYYPPDDFTSFNHLRRKRCVSCNNLINYDAVCLQFDCYRDARDDYEESRFGDEVEMASKYMCSKCGEIFLNLTDIGYCHNLGDNIKEDLDDYWDMTGFEST